MPPIGDNFLRGLIEGSRQTQAAEESAANRQLQLRQLQAQITANARNAAIAERLQALREKEFVSVTAPRAEREAELFKEVTLPSGRADVKAKKVGIEHLREQIRNLEFMNTLRARVAEEGAGGLGGPEVLLGLGPSLIGLQGTRAQIGALADLRGAQTDAMRARGGIDTAIMLQLMTSPSLVRQILGGGVGSQLLIPR